MTSTARRASARAEKTSRTRVQWDAVVLWTGYLVLTIALTSLPARHCISIQQAQYGLARTAYWPTAFAIDLGDYLPLLVGLCAALGLVGARLMRRRPDGFAQALRIALPVAALLFFLFILPMTVSGAEFKVHRGLHPTFVDWYTGMQQPGLIAGGVTILLLERFFQPAIVAVAGFVLINLLFVAETRRTAARLDCRSATVLLGVVAGVWLVSHGVHLATPSLLAGVSQQRAPKSQLATLLGSGLDHRRARLGAIDIFERVELPPGSRAAGAGVMGFSGEAAARLQPDWQGRPCSPHPLAVPLPPSAEDGADHDRPEVEPLRAALRSLSQEIFAGGERPLRIWQVLAESFRAADVQALNPRAPYSIAPHVNDWYARAADPASTVMASTHTYQAGTRTSQGLAAVTCGMGTMPLGLSFVRDIGLVPFRCLPDVLVDAGFTASFYYGSNPEFDRMKPFLQYHGFAHVRTPPDFVEDLPPHGGDVPDRIVARRSVVLASELPPDRPQYNVLMSLTNHVPYTLPADYPPEVERQVQQAVHTSGRAVGRDDLTRLRTFAYADHALHELVTSISESPAGQDSIIVITADHSSPEVFVWMDVDRAEPRELERLLTQLPLVIVFPDTFVRASADPVRLRQAIGRVKQELWNRRLSQNDIPHLVLELTSASPRLASLPAAWRWHTMGGQALSDAFAVDGESNAAVVGIDAASHTFTIDRQGRLGPHRDPTIPTLIPEQAAQSAPLLRPAIAFFSALLRGYSHSCRGPAHIRQSAASH